MPAIELPGIRLTRVGYVDVPIPPETVGLSPDQFADIPWASNWTDGSNVMAGAAAWFADVDAGAAPRRIVFDPMLAADDALRADRATEAAQQQAIADVLANAGFARETVDIVLLSHVDGIGMTGWRDDDGGWQPFFPNARILLSDVEIAAFVETEADDSAAGSGFRALQEQGAIYAFHDGERIAGCISAEVTGDHGPGHATFHLGAAGAPTATVLGHLAVSPLHLATGACPGLHVDPDAAWSTLEALKQLPDRLLIGPLWPAPGCARWSGAALTPA